MWWPTMPRRGVPDTAAMSTSAWHDRSLHSHGSNLHQWGLSKRVIKILCRDCPGPAQKPLASQQAATFVEFLTLWCKLLIPEAVGVGDNQHL